MPVNLYQNPKMHSLIQTLSDPSCAHSTKQDAVDSFFKDQSIMTQLNKELNIRTRKKAPALYQRLVERGDTYFIGEAYEYFVGLTASEKISSFALIKDIAAQTNIQSIHKDDTSILSKWVTARLSDISDKIIISHRHAMTQLDVTLDGGLKRYRYSRNHKMHKAFTQEPFDEKKAQCLFLEHDEIYQKLYHDCKTNHLFEPANGITPDSVAFKVGLYQHLKDGYQRLQKPVFDELVYGYLKNITQYGDISRIKRVIDIDRDTINAPLSNNNNIIALDDPLRYQPDSEAARQTDMFTAQRMAFLQDLNMIMSAAPLMRRKALVELYGGIRQANEVENNLQVIHGYLTAELKTDSGINDLSKVTGLERQTVSRIFKNILDNEKSSLLKGLQDNTVETSRDAIRLIKGQMLEILKEYRTVRKLKAAQVTAIPLQQLKSQKNQASLREI